MKYIIDENIKYYECETIFKNNYINNEYVYIVERQKNKNILIAKIQINCMNGKFNEYEQENLINKIIRQNKLNKYLCKIINKEYFESLMQEQKEHINIKILYQDKETKKDIIDNLGNYIETKDLYKEIEFDNSIDFKKWKTIKEYSSEFKIIKITYNN